MADESQRGFGNFRNIPRVAANAWNQTEFFFIITLVESAELKGRSRMTRAAHSRGSHQVARESAILYSSTPDNGEVMDLESRSLAPNVLDEPRHLGDPASGRGGLFLL
jgi:hypothetical protein